MLRIYMTRESVFQGDNLVLSVLGCTLLFQLSRHFYKLKFTEMGLDHTSTAHFSKAKQSKLAEGAPKV